MRSIRWKSTPRSNCARRPGTTTRATACPKPRLVSSIQPLAACSSTASCPNEVQFVNEKLDKGGVKDLIAEVYELCGQEMTTDVADQIKDHWL